MSNKDKPADKGQEPAGQPEVPAKVAPVAKGISALTLARIATARLGRPVNDKRVRSVARETLARFIDRDGYTAHAYTPAEAATLLATMSSKGRGIATMTQAEAEAALVGIGAEAAS